MADGGSRMIGPWEGTRTVAPDSAIFFRLEDRSGALPRNPW